MPTWNSDYQWDSYEPEIRAYLAAAGGGFRLTTIRALNTFVRTGKRAGWWQKLAEVYPFCGPSLASALVKLKAAPGNATSLVNAGFVEVDYSEAVGFGQSATASKYLMTGISIGGIGGSSTNFSVGGFPIRTPNSDAGFILSDTTVSGDCLLHFGSAIAGAGGKENSSPVSVLQPRVFSSDANHYFNMVDGVLFDRSHAGNTIPSFTTTNELTLFRRTFNGADAVFYSNSSSGILFVGAALTEAEGASITKALLALERVIRTGIPNITASQWGFTGDSITFGQGASPVANQWTNKVAAARGKVELNFGSPNSAVTFEWGAPVNWAVSLLNRYADIFSIDFEKHFICYGTNDAVADDTTNGDAVRIAAYRVGLTTVLQAFAGRYGAGNVFAISPQWRQDRNATFNSAWNAALAAACSAAGVTFIDYYSVLMSQATPANFCADTLHPNNAGHDLLATTILGYV